MSLIRQLLRESSSEENVIAAFLGEYVERHGGVKACRHGGCYELVEAFMQKHPDAEMWETVEAETELPLVPPYEQVQALLQGPEATLEDLGSLGMHAVAKWRGFVFDAAGVSTFERITTYFGLREGQVFWARTC